MALGRHGDYFLAQQLLFTMHMSIKSPVDNLGGNNLIWFYTSAYFIAAFFFARAIHFEMCIMNTIRFKVSHLINRSNHLIRKLKIFLILSILCHLPLMSQAAAQTKHLALVVGGPSLEEGTRHEFARNFAAVSIGLKTNGFQVTGLFGGKIKNNDLYFKLDNISHFYSRGMDFNLAELENGKYKYEYDFLENQNLISDGATYLAIERYFFEIIKISEEIKSLDLHIEAHGIAECLNDTKTSTNRAFDAEIQSHDELSENCESFLLLYNENGAVIKYPAKRLLEFILTLERRKIHVNSNLSACHMGYLKKHFKNLNNSCVFIPSTGNSFSFGCVDEKDSTADLPLHTSTSEVMGLRYYVKSLDKLLDIPFFRESKCFNLVISHYRQHQKEINFSSPLSTFWSARKYDNNPQEPALNSLIKNSYFKKSIFAAELADKNKIVPIDEKPISHEFEVIIRSIDATKRPILITLKKHLHAKLLSYNRIVTQLLEINNMSFDKVQSMSQAVIKKTYIVQKNLERRRKAVSQEIIKFERHFIEEARRYGDLKSEKNDGCLIEN